MEKFTLVKSVVAPLPINNVDTDMIIPKQFLTTIKRTGLGKNLFDEMRYTKEGEEIKDFVLNKDIYRKSQILLSRDNFGCGSSREHAPWAIKDFGISVIIAESFADIFFGNCFKNAILPVTLDKNIIDELFAIVNSNIGVEFTVDLENQYIETNGKKFNFNIDPSRKQILLEGLDDIASTLKHEDKISEFEENRKKDQPWLWQKTS